MSSSPSCVSSSCTSSASSRSRKSCESSERKPLAEMCDWASAPLNCAPSSDSTKRMTPAALAGSESQVCTIGSKTRWSYLIRMSEMLGAGAPSWNSFASSAVSYSRRSLWNAVSRAMSCRSSEPGARCAPTSAIALRPLLPPRTVNGGSSRRCPHRPRPMLPPWSESRFERRLGAGR